MGDEESDLNCAICFEEQEDPRCLECIHSFCYNCLSNLLEARKLLQCPTCRKVTKKELKDLPKNFYHMKIKEAAEKGASLVHKILIETPNEAELQKIREQSQAEAARAAKVEAEILQILGAIEQETVQAVAAQRQRVEATLGSWRSYHEQTRDWAMQTEKLRQDATARLQGGQSTPATAHLTRPTAAPAFSGQLLRLRKDSKALAQQLVANFSAQLHGLVQVKARSGGTWSARKREPQPPVHPPQQQQQPPPQQQPPQQQPPQQQPPQQQRPQQPQWPPPQQQQSPPQQQQQPTVQRRAASARPSLISANLRALAGPGKQLLIPVQRPAAAGHSDDARPSSGEFFLINASQTPRPQLPAGRTARLPPMDFGQQAQGQSTVPSYTHRMQ